MTFADTRGRAELIPADGEPLGGLNVTLGSRASAERAPGGGVILRSRDGQVVSARPGDWLIVTMGGALHVARTDG